MDKLDEVQAWSSLAELHSKLGDKSEASKSFQRALAAAGKVSDPFQQAFALRAIAAALARAASPLAAASIYRQALSTASSIPDETARLTFIEGTIELAHEVAARAWRTGK